MVNSCAAYDCKNRRVKGDGMKFHRFPVKNKEHLHFPTFLTSRFKIKSTVKR